MSLIESVRSLRRAMAMASMACFGDTPPSWGWSGLLHACPDEAPWLVYEAVMSLPIAAKQATKLQAASSPVGTAAAWQQLWNPKISNVTLHCVSAAGVAKA